MGYSRALTLGLVLSIARAELRAGRAGRAPDASKSLGSITRRALVGSAVLLPAASARSEVRYAPARYNLVPQGDLRDKERRLAEVVRELRGKPDDAYLLGEQAQLEYDIDRLRENAAAIDKLRVCASSGSGYAERLTLRVPDLAAARTFWVEGLKMSELRSGRVDGASSLVVGYGRESLSDGDDGGKFALELVQASASAPTPEPMSAGSSAAAGALLYMQLRVPNVRISSLIDSGGTIESAYGFVEVISPSGLPVRVLTAPRRDPFEFIAVRVADVEAAAAYYERAFGMRRIPAPPKRLQRDGGLLGTGLFGAEYEVQEDVLRPKTVYGSVLMVPSCCGEADAMGVLLVPPNADSVPLGLRPTGSEGDPTIHISTPDVASALIASGSDARGFARDPSGTRLQISELKL
jgi:catechol 2,3-dioxygenase-like lactoylglutathione lyase family enzyme